MRTVCSSNRLLGVSTQTPSWADTPPPVWAPQFPPNVGLDTPLCEQNEWQTHVNLRKLRCGG